MVCTANICRSPAGAALLAADLRDRGVTAVVNSAGIAVGSGDRPADPWVSELLALRGIDLGAHRSRPLHAELVAGSDLVLTMERRHLREAAVLARGEWQHVYTLREFARRARRVGPRGASPLAGWLSLVHGDRNSRELLLDDGLDDVSDPTGGTAQDYRRLVADLEGLVAEVGTLLG